MGVWYTIQGCFDIGYQLFSQLDIVDRESVYHADVWARGLCYLLIYDKIFNHYKTKEEDSTN